MVLRTIGEDDPGLRRSCAQLLKIVQGLSQKVVLRDAVVSKVRFRIREADWWGGADQASDFLAYWLAALDRIVSVYLNHGFMGEIRYAQLFDLRYLVSWMNDRAIRVEKCEGRVYEGFGVIRYYSFTTDNPSFYRKPPECELGSNMTALLRTCWA